MTGAIKPGARRDAYKGDDTAGVLTAEAVSRSRRVAERTATAWPGRAVALANVHASPAPPRHRRRTTTSACPTRLVLWKNTMHGASCPHRLRPTSRTVRADSGGGVPNTRNASQASVATCWRGECRPGATCATGATSVPRHRRRPPRRQSSGECVRDGSTVTDRTSALRSRPGGTHATPRRTRPPHPCVHR